MKSAVLTLLCAITIAQGREFFLGSRQLCICNPSDSHEICANWDLENIVIAHERCDKFYKCAYGKPVPYCCPRGTVFNIEKEGCDWPSNVQCGDRGFVPDDENECLKSNDNGGGSGGGDDGNEDLGPCNCDPSEAPSICKAPGSEGVLVAHEYCNHFYKCNHGRPVAMKCGPHTLYNPYTRECAWAHEVECGDRIIPEDDESDVSNENDGGEGGDNIQRPCNCDPAKAPEICAAEGSEGTLVAHEYCHKFYKCNHGRPFPMTCPPHTLYNPHTERCDWPRDVDCGDRICVCDDGDNECDGGSGVSEEDAGEVGGDPGSCNCNPSEAPNICAQEGSDGVLVAHENCNQFYKCINGKPVPMYCPHGLLYNPHKKACDWPHNVDCGDRVIPDDKDEDNDDNDSTDSVEDSPGDEDGGGGSCNCDPSEAPNICAQEGSDGVLVAHENCNQFYKCNYGKPVAMYCPPGLLYNPHIKECDWPNNVDCGDRVIPDDKNEDSDENNDGDSNENNDDCQGDSNLAPEICAAPGSNGLLTSHPRCDRFFMCTGGQAIVLSCPSNMPLFNPVIGACDEAANVDCGDRIVPDPDADPCPCFNSMPATCTTPGSHGMQIPHEKCNQFYTCIHGSAVTHTCPQGLLYEPRRQVCEWPIFVSCEGRIIPSMSRLANNKHLSTSTILLSK